MFKVMFDGETIAEGDLERAIQFAQHMLRAHPCQDYTQPLSQHEIAIRILTEAAFRPDVQLDADEIRSLMAKALSKPKRRRGSQPFQFEARDILIISKIGTIRQEFGFDYTANPASRACEREGISLTEAAILKIWQITHSQ